MRLHIHFLVCLAFSFVVSIVGQEAEDVLVNALKDELVRSLSELQLEDEPKPYFISYAVNESRSTSVTAVLGAKTAENSLAQRLLSVSIRVGDASLDNSNFGSPGLLVYTTNLPVTDSYDELRRVIWQATDTAYKEAVSTLASKKTALESRTEEKTLADFSIENQFVFDDPNFAQAFDFDHESLNSRVIKLSGVALGDTAIQTSSTTGTFVQVARTYLDSQENFHRVVSRSCTLQTHASMQLPNGRIIKDVNSVYAETCELLPNIDTLIASQTLFTTRLDSLQDAEELESYAGPVLIEDQAAANFLVQMLLGRLSARPELVVDAQMMGFGQFPENPFQSKVGRRVFPKFLSLTNDPLMTSFDEAALLGSFIVDAEGMPARRTELIQDGELKTLLTTRAPVEDMTESTGSNRLQSGALPGNLMVTSNETSSRDELIELLLELADDSGEDFGIIVRRIQNPDELAPDFNTMMSVVQGAMTGSLSVFPTLEAFKIYPDGSEVPILPASFANINDSILRDIVAVSEQKSAFNVPITFQSTIALFSLSNIFAAGALNPVFVGVVTPGLLIEEIELSDAGGDKPRLPIVPHPLLESSTN